MEASNPSCPANITTVNVMHREVFESVVLSARKGPGTVDRKVCAVLFYSLTKQPGSC